MLYLIHDDEGRITQANKLYADPSGYDARLRDLGHRFIKADRNHLPQAEHWHVRDGEMRARPEMFVVVSKHIIKAGGKDAAVLYGCPVGATFAVMTGGVVVDSGVLDDPELECAFEVPCRLTILLDRWPYQTRKIDIEVVP